MSEPIVTLARTAGFCFGVSRAVALCDRLLDEGRPIATLGPIIHNEQVVGRLAARGCVAVNDPAEAAGRTLVIRSHGVGEQVYDRCRTLGIPVEDATCLFVAKIHKAVSEPSLSRGTGITPKCREFSAIAAATASFLGVLPNFRQ